MLGVAVWYEAAIPLEISRTARLLGNPTCGFALEGMTSAPVHVPDYGFCDYVRVGRAAEPLTESVSFEAIPEQLR